MSHRDTTRSQMSAFFFSRRSFFPKRTGAYVPIFDISQMIPLRQRAAAPRFSACVSAFLRFLFSSFVCFVSRFFFRTLLEPATRALGTFVARAHRATAFEKKKMEKEKENKGKQRKIEENMEKQASFHNLPLDGT